LLGLTEEESMTKSDRELGMDRSITRRDFLNGMSVAVGGALVVPATADAESWFQRSPAPVPSSDYYPHPRLITTRPR
jgi:hypothetical protein